MKEREKMTNKPKKTGLSLAVDHIPQLSDANDEDIALYFAKIVDEFGLPFRLEPKQKTASKNLNEIVSLVDFRNFVANKASDINYRVEKI